VIAAKTSAAAELAAPNISYLSTFDEEHYDQAETAVRTILEDAGRRAHRALLADRAGLARKFDPRATGAAYFAAVRDLLGRT
jgi:hypothetical protein